MYDSLRPDLGWTSVSNLPTARESLAAAALNGKIYAIGGSGSPDAKRVYEYDPLRPVAGWTSVSNLPVDCSSLAAAVANNKIYAVGRSSQPTAFESLVGSGVAPPLGPLTGSNTVIISGSNLGNENDITNVTLCAIPVLSILSRSATQVVVKAGISEVETNGSVTVFSDSYGITTRSNAYSYMYPVISVLGVDGTVIANNAAPSVTQGTDFGGWLLGSSSSRTLAVSNSGAVMTIADLSIHGAGAAQFAVTGMPHFIDASSVSNFSIAFSPTEVGLHTAVVEIVTDATNSPYRINVQGMGVSLTTNNGPLKGGNTITITGSNLGNGSDITNVTICGIAATITGQTNDSVTVIVGASLFYQSGHIVVQSASLGIQTIWNSYAYNPPGYIFGPLEGWTAISNLPTARNQFAVASAGGKVFAMGGYAADAVATVEVYDPLQPTNGWVSTNSLPSERYDLAGASASGQLFAIAGMNRYWAIQSTVFMFDTLNPGAGWTTISSLPAARSSLAAVGVNGKIYAIGGYNNGDAQATVYMYDTAQPGAGWTSVSNLPAGRQDLAATAINGTIYAIGGSDDSSRQSNVFAYDTWRPEAGWTTISNLPAARSSPGAVAVNGILYALGGYGSCATSSVYAYDPLQPARGWTSVSNLPTAQNPSPAAEANGQIYVVGTAVYESRIGAGVQPVVSPLAGSNTVVISGSSLGSEGDITNVTLCGIPVREITSQSSTQVVVLAGPGPAQTSGAVTVYSVSRGSTTRSNAFSYGNFMLISASAGSNGLVNPAGIVFVLYDGSTNFQFLASNYYHVESVLTNGGEIVIVNPTNFSFVWSNITANGTIVGGFAENLCPYGTPEWWLASYNLATGGLTFAQAETNDADRDGLRGWQEYVSDTNPTNVASCFHIAALSNAPDAAVYFPSSSNRQYALNYCTNLLNGPWVGVEGQSNRTGNGSVFWLADSNAVPPRYYRVRVQMP